MNSLDVLWSVGTARSSFWALRTHASLWEAAGFDEEREGGLPFGEGVAGGMGVVMRKVNTLQEGRDGVPSVWAYWKVRR